MVTASASAQLIAVKPITVNRRGTAGRSDRGPDLVVKVTAPMQGRDLPVVVFSHGNAWSMDGYEPLVDRWAAAGFVVIQPTHLDSRRHGIGFDDPRFATIWRTRIDDVHAVLDQVGPILATAAGLDARTDQDRIAVVGHSWGAHTMSALLGARVLGPAGAPEESFSHPGAKAGVLIAVTGTGDSLTPFAAEHLPFMRPDYTTMTTPALIIAGGKDRSRMSTRGADWFTDAYHCSPAPKTLLTIPDGEHTLGGIAGEAVAETTDQSTARVELVADATSAYLQHALDLTQGPWAATLANAASALEPYTVEQK